MVFILFPESQRLSLPLSAPTCGQFRARKFASHARTHVSGMREEAGDPARKTGRTCELHTERTQGQRFVSVKSLIKKKQKNKPKSKSKVEWSYVTEACCPSRSSYWLWMLRPKSISVLKVEVLPLPWPKPFLPLSHQKAAKRGRTQKTDGGFITFASQCKTLKEGRGRSVTQQCHCSMKLSEKEILDM